MKDDWGIVGCGRMATEYCRVLISKGISPRVFSRNSASSSVQSFKQTFPQLAVQAIAGIHDEVSNWLVCTNIESHEEVCSQLAGDVYCEKPYALRPGYDTDRNISILMNRRYYHWVEFVRNIIDEGNIRKIIAFIPEKGVDALITQAIHVIDLLWYLSGAFRPAMHIGNDSPSYFLTTDKDISLIINMNYGSHENFSVRFYAKDRTVYEARPLEAFSITDGMEVREPDGAIPVRTYKPITRQLEYTASAHKPGLDELLDDLIQGSSSRLPSLGEHRRIHTWMQDNML